MTPTGTAIAARGIRKSYGSLTALDGFDLTVEAGTVCGLLGPNGSGKTTAVKCLATLLRPDAGSARISGLDVVSNADAVRRRIGLTGQYAAVDEILTGHENLVMFGRLYGLTVPAAKRRAGELLEHFDLVEVGKRSVAQYSGGMRRRLDLAASLVQAPEVLFLDEPTTGLDPRSRNQVWTGMRQLVEAGATVLLTTQYLEEADQLANRIAVLDTGKVIAEGTADELKSRVGGDQVDVIVRDEAFLSAAADVLRRLGEPSAVEHERKLSMAVQGDRITMLNEILRLLGDAGINVEDIGVRRPTLDEVFLGLTGRRAGEPEPEGAAS
ncbi:MULTISPECIES: ATP-binding cassette domain-containing protein [Amycolatopsis]|uniref:ATP-binding cassette domain-containing protein n=1 Tax=Amycolatopsis albidoflavus TaxID=102226 RepID=A0ABW5HX08_9PSEU